MIVGKGLGLDRKAIAEVLDKAGVAGLYDVYKYRGAIRVKKRFTYASGDSAEYSVKCVREALEEAGITFGNIWNAGLKDGYFLVVIES